MKLMHSIFFIFYSSLNIKLSGAPLKQNNQFCIQVKKKKLIIIILTFDMIKITK